MKKVLAGILTLIMSMTVACGCFFCFGFPNFSNPASESEPINNEEVIGNWVDFQSDSLKGEGTKESPWKISSGADFALMSSRYNNPEAVVSAFGAKNNSIEDDYFELTSDIDLSAHVWTPIDVFSGHLNGNGHTVTLSSISVEKEISSKSVSAKERNDRYSYIAKSRNAIYNAEEDEMAVDGRRVSGRMAKEQLNYVNTAEDAVGAFSNVVYTNGIGIQDVNFIGRLSVYGALQPDSNLSSEQSTLYIGGVVGMAYNTTILNVVSKVIIELSYKREDILSQGISNPITYRSESIGGVVGLSEGAKLEDCFFTGIIDMSSEGDTQTNNIKYYSVGGIVGAARNSSTNYATFFACMSMADIRVSLYNTRYNFIYGGIAGTFAALSMRDCVANNVLESGLEPSSEAVVGGVVGSVGTCNPIFYSFSGGYNNAIIEDSYNYSNLTWGNALLNDHYYTNSVTYGGIVGGIEEYTFFYKKDNEALIPNRLSIYSCANFANANFLPVSEYEQAKGAEGNFGGIIGYHNPLYSRKTDSTVCIQDCGNYGEIITDQRNSNINLGGIAGEIRNKAVINRCINVGKLEGTRVGGIIALAGFYDNGFIGIGNKTYDDVYVVNCINSGTLIGKSKVGQISSDFRGTIKTSCGENNENAVYDKKNSDYEYNKGLSIGVKYLVRLKYSKSWLDETSWTDGETYLGLKCLDYKNSNWYREPMDRGVLNIGLTFPICGDDYIVPYRAVRHGNLSVYWTKDIAELDSDGNKIDYAADSSIIGLYDKYHNENAIAPSEYASLNFVYLIGCDYGINNDYSRLEYKDLHEKFLIDYRNENALETDVAMYSLRNGAINFCDFPSWNISNDRILEFKMYLTASEQKVTEVRYYLNNNEYGADYIESDIGHLELSNKSDKAYLNESGEAIYKSGDEAKNINFRYKDNLSLKAIPKFGYKVSKVAVVNRRYKHTDENAQSYDLTNVEPNIERWARIIENPGLGEVVWDLAGEEAIENGTREGFGYDYQTEIEVYFDRVGYTIYRNIGGVLEGEAYTNYSGNQNSAVFYISNTLLDSDTSLNTDREYDVWFSSVGSTGVTDTPYKGVPLGDSMSLGKTYKVYCNTDGSEGGVEIGTYRNTTEFFINFETDIFNKIKNSSTFINTSVLYLNVTVEDLGFTVNLVDMLNSYKSTSVYKTPNELEISELKDIIISNFGGKSSKEMSFSGSAELKTNGAKFGYSGIPIFSFYNYDSEPATKFDISGNSSEGYSLEMKDLLEKYKSWMDEHMDLAPKDEKGETILFNDTTEITIYCYYKVEHYDLKLDNKDAENSDVTVKDNGNSVALSSGVYSLYYHSPIEITINNFGSNLFVGYCHGGKVLSNQDTYKFSNSPDGSKQVMETLELSIEFLKHGEATTPNSSGNVYSISKVSELVWISQNINAYNGFENIIFNQTNDIDMQNQVFIPIGSEKTPFKGVYNGNGYKIINFTDTDGYVNNVSNVGMFGVTENATIKNLTVQNGTISGYSNVGAVVGYAKNTTFTHVNNFNCKVDLNDVTFADLSDTSIVKTGDEENQSRENFAGLVGKAEGCTFFACSNRANIPTGNAYASYSNKAGLIGLVDNNTTIDQCFSEIKNGDDYVDVVLVNGGIDSKLTNSYYNYNGTYYIRGASSYITDFSNTEIWITLNNDKKVLKVFYWG